MSDEELIARWDDYVESMGSVMGEVEHMAQQMRDRIEALVKERDEAVIKRAAWELEAKTQQARAERLEAAIRELKRCWYQGDLTENDFAAALKGADHE